MRPAPDPDWAGWPGQLVHLLQALRPFQKEFRYLVVGEDGGVTIAISLDSCAVREEFLGDLLGFRAIDAKVDGCFGEGSPEIFEGNRERNCGDRDGNHNDPELFGR